ncbi:zeta toxin family protein [Sodiomyces alkalinus F11]|uniref:Zeta toxin family protein n=1 Tax=Sodiomyces alkalinus (strain CBS 110278 / VKM F-3762 / F11) TaxID=1314773 RepID=A0A3N2PUE0_SODAK|nr:zeta toxin family protein [Sodiomyces alkalinus F11]ROT37936.1 zeta toxin family protein [Sodiomyces alkalinus F11]
MPPPPDLSSYILPQETSNSIFTTQILPAEFPPNVSPSPLVLSPTDPKPPIAVLIVGQTGAGKTRLAPAVLTALTSLRRQPPAHFIADTYKTYHPAYQSLTSDPATAPLASPATGPDARRWLRLAAAHAAHHRLDVLLESACRHPDDFVHLARLFRDARYRLDVLLLAVPRPLSRLGILTRFHDRLPEAGSRGLPIRLTPLKVHDDSYVGLLDAARWIDAHPDCVDRVFVVRRGNLVAFSDDAEARSGTGPGPRLLSGRVVDAVQRERERPLTPDEITVASEDLARLQARDEAQASQIKELLDPLLKPSVDPDAAAVFPELKPLQFPPDGTDPEATFLLGAT